MERVLKPCSNENYCKYMDFDGETITSELAVDSKQVNWRYECREKSIAEFFQSKDNVLIMMLERWRHLMPSIVWMLRGVLLKFMEINR